MTTIAENVPQLPTELVILLNTYLFFFSRELSFKIRSLAAHDRTTSRRVTVASRRSCHFHFLIIYWALIQKSVFVWRLTLPLLDLWTYSKVTESVLCDSSLCGLVSDCFQVCVPIWCLWWYVCLERSRRGRRQLLLQCCHLLFGQCGSLSTMRKEKLVTESKVYLKTLAKSLSICLIKKKQDVYSLIGVGVRKH